MSEDTDSQSRDATNEAVLRMLADLDCEDGLAVLTIRRTGEEVPSSEDPGRHPTPGVGALISTIEASIANERKLVARKPGPGVEPWIDGWISVPVAKQVLKRIRALDRREPDVDLPLKLTAWDRSHDLRWWFHNASVSASVLHSEIMHGGLEHSFSASWELESSGRFKLKGVVVVGRSGRRKHVTQAAERDLRPHLADAMDEISRSVIPYILLRLAKECRAAILQELPSPLPVPPSPLSPASGHITAQLEVNGIRLDIRLVSDITIDIPTQELVLEVDGLRCDYTLGGRITADQERRPLAAMHARLLPKIWPPFDLSRKTDRYSVQTEFTDSLMEAVRLFARDNEGLMRQARAGLNSRANHRFEQLEAAKTKRILMLASLAEDLRHEIDRVEALEPIG